MAKQLRVIRPRNKAEGAFFDWAFTQGWIPSKRGWPDFFCINQAGELMVVDVKTKRGAATNKWQSVVMQKLKKAGIPCYTWEPSTQTLTPVKDHEAFNVELTHRGVRGNRDKIGKIPASK